MNTVRAVACLLTMAVMAPGVSAQQGNALDAETLQHFQALLRIDTSSPPGNETKAVEYLKQVFEKEGIPYQVFAKDASRANIVARLKGNGKKKPILVMGHTDVVTIDPAKWTHKPFGADLDGGYVYGRGTVDDKDNLVAGLMMMLQLKRNKVPLDRDVILLAEAGEEGAPDVGAQFMADNHLDAINAEYCFAEGGGVVRSGVAHCMEAAVSAAAILEPHGYPPLVMSLESIDRLDHVVFVYRSRRTGRWGSIGRSRDIGLNGRRAVFGSLRALARSYMDHYVDDTGRITGYGVANLADAMGGYDWRLAMGNIWAVERMLIDLPHTPLPSSDARYRRLRARYRHA